MGHCVVGVLLSVFFSHAIIFAKEERDDSVLADV